MRRTRRPTPLARSALAGVALVAGAAPAVARAQDAPDTTAVRLAPAFFSGGDARSVGGAWEVLLRRARTRRDGTPAVPSATCRGIRPAPELTAELASDGGAAVDPDANQTPMRASARAGLWWSLYRPGCPSTDPMEPPTGGWYFGSVKLSAHARLEGDQRLRESNGLFGADLLWTHSQATGAWRFVPSLLLSYGAALPVRSALRDSLAAGTDAYRRGEVHAVWHVPLVARFTAHANVRGWKSYGLAAPVAAASADDGLFTAFDLAYGPEWRIGPVAIPELFVRRVDGAVPEDWRQRRTWMIGIVAGR